MISKFILSFFIVLVAISGCVGIKSSDCSTETLEFLTGLGNGISQEDFKEFTDLHICLKYIMNNQLDPKFSKLADKLRSIGITPSNIPSIGNILKGGFVGGSALYVCGATGPWMPVCLVSMVGLWQATDYVPTFFEHLNQGFEKTKKV